MISLKNLSKVYRTTEVETTALRELNLEVRKGEFVAVMGPSGCGKSTFLNIVGMLDNPSAGEYWFDGRNIAGYRLCGFARVPVVHDHRIAGGGQTARQNRADAMGGPGDESDLRLVFRGDRHESEDRRFRTCRASLDGGEGRGSQHRLRGGVQPDR